MPNTEQSIAETGGVPEIEMEVEVFGMVQAAVDKTLSIPDMAADAKAVGDAIDEINTQMADVLLDIREIESYTGEDIKVNSDEGAPSIADAIAQIFANLYPVGSVYITSAETLPEVIASNGTWTEIAMPLRLVDIKKGSRTYAEPEAGYEPGNLHMWMRTE